MIRVLEITFADPTTGAQQPAVWRDKLLVVHRVVGADVQDGIRLLWTACEKKDVPANAAWLQRVGDYVTCAGCRQAGVLFDEEARENKRANSQFGVGA